MTGVCPACSAATPAGASFCEACGSDLDATPEAGCAQCGSIDQLEGDYCLVCGHKQPAARDHLEIDHGVVVAVTDRGQRHHHNEDAVAIAAFEGGAAIVVCDGVSTTDSPEVASQAAVDAALPVLENAGGRGSDAGAAMRTAVAHAQAAVVAVLAAPGGEGNPSCTFVAALVQGSEVTVGWLGDSRAYWLGPTSQQLTTDHSWAIETAASGTMTIEAASADPRASTITRWLGIDAVDAEPDLAHFELEPGGTLLICSDGFWNYAPTVDDLLAHPALAGPTLIDQAAALVEFANDSGGHDNITVALARIGPLAGSPGDAT